MEQFPIILDGALGSELERRGVNSKLPLWSAHALIEAPDQIKAIHRDNLQAGAEILTAATFRTSRYALSKEGLENRAAELTNLAVQLARDAIRELEVAPPNPPVNGGELGFPPACGGDRGGKFVAGSLAPLEDCYHPELRPPDDTILREHAHQARLLKQAGVDIILVETQNSAREAQLATEMALNTGLPVWTSLLPKSATELLSGDSLVETAWAVYALGVDAVLINCCEPDLALAAFTTVKSTLPADEIRLGLYPNLLGTAQTPDDFARWGRAAIESGALIVGGCCGTTPDHLKALVAQVKALRNTEKI
jgi:homocysteine S-methyltransferase